MANTASSEACLALYLYAKSFSVSRALTAHVMAPLSYRVVLRSPAAKVSWVISCSGRFARLLGIKNGHKQLGMKRTNHESSRSIPTLPTGRNKLSHALSQR